MAMVTAWKSRPWSKAEKSAKSPNWMRNAAWMTPKARTTVSAFCQSGLRSKPPEQAVDPGDQGGHLHDRRETGNPSSMAAPYAFSPAGSPKMPVGFTSSTMMRMVKATASRIGVEM